MRSLMSRLRLEKLAGYGPIAAVVSGVSLIVCLVILLVGPTIAPNFDAFSVTLVLIAAVAATLWPASLVVVGVDLRWLEHPATHTGRMQASLWAVAIAAVSFPIFGIVIAVASNTSVPAIPLAVLAICMSFYLIVQNWEARKAGLLQGVLPWIGLVSGGCFAIMGFGFVVGLASPIFFGLGFLGFFAAIVCFSFWSIWLGIRLRGVTQPAAPAATTA
jgi:hypothetical protein